MKLGKATNHEILIKPTSNQGFIIEIGPKQFCFEGRQNMIRALNKYLQDPIQLEKDLREKEGVISREYILGLGLGEREDEESKKFQENDIGYPFYYRSSSE